MVQNELDLLRDIKEFFKDYYSLERDYMKNLDTLAKKHSTRIDQKKAYDSASEFVSFFFHVADLGFPCGGSS